MRTLAAYDPRHSLNAICPYYTMFPLEFPLRSLSLVKGSKYIADPFCGRGTTLYASRFLGMECFGIDSSPVATAISKAKLATADYSEVVSLAKIILSKKSEVDTPRDLFWRLAYHPSVLVEICKFRQELLVLPNSHSAAILRAAMMGILHGPLTKIGSYLSNQMQRTFSPKPDYSIRYWSKRNLNPPKVDVLAAIKRKLRRIYLSPAFKNNVSPATQVVCGDASNSDTWEQCPFRIDTVITSPPYYGMRTYVEDQWLRNWFIGGPDHVAYGSSLGLPMTSPDQFAQGLSNVWNQVGKQAEGQLDVFVRFGILPSRNLDAKELLLSSFEESDYSWKRIYTKAAATASSGRRQVAQMRTFEKAQIEFDMHLRLI